MATRESFYEIRNDDFQGWVAGVRARAARSKGVDFRKMAAEYRAAARKRSAAYAKAETQNLSIEAYDAVVEKYDRPISRMMIQAEVELKRRHGVQEFDRPRALVADGMVIVYTDPTEDSRTYASTTVVLPEDVVTLEGNAEDGLTPMRLTRTEVGMVEAYRNRDTFARPTVIGRFNEPRTIAELAEVIRIFLDVNFHYCVDEYGPGDNRLDIQTSYNDGEIPPTSIFFREYRHYIDTLDTLTEDEVKLLADYRARQEEELEERHRQSEAEREAQPEWLKRANHCMFLNDEEVDQIKVQRAERMLTESADPTMFKPASN